MGRKKLFKATVPTMEAVRSCIPHGTALIAAYKIILIPLCNGYGIEKWEVERLQIRDKGRTIAHVILQEFDFCWDCPPFGASRQYLLLHENPCL